MSGIELLVRPHERNEGLGIAQVDDIVRETRQHMDGLDLVARDLELPYLVAADAALLDEPAPRDDDEKFPLAVMPMLPFRDARLGDVHAELPALLRLEKLGEAAARILVHLEGKGRLLPGKIGKIGRIQLLCKTSRRDLGKNERLGLHTESLQKIGDLPQRHLMGDRHIAIAAVGVRNGGKAVEPTAVLLPFERIQHLLHQIVDVKKFELGIAVVDPDGQIVGDVMAKGRHGTVIVGAAPLAEEVGETIDEHFGARLARIGKEQLLPRLLAAAVVAVVSADERRLDGRGKHHGAGVAALFERRKQLRRKTEVARHELGGVLRAVDARKMKDEICLLAVLCELFLGRIEVVLADLADLQSGAGTILIVADIFERFRQILPHEPLRTGNENVHFVFSLRSSASSS